MSRAERKNCRSDGSLCLNEGLSVFHQRNIEWRISIKNILVQACQIICKSLKNITFETRLTAKHRVFLNGPLRPIWATRESIHSFFNLFISFSTFSFFSIHTCTQMTL